MTLYGDFRKCGTRFYPVRCGAVHGFSNGPQLCRSPLCIENKRPQAKCPPTCEMSVCGEYVCMYVKKCHQRDDKFPPLPPLKAPPLIKHSMGLFK